MIFILLLRPVFDFIFKTHNIGWIIYLIPIGVIINILLEVYTNWNVRNKLFKNNAVASIGSSVSTKLSNIGFGLTVGSTSLGLILSQKIGAITSILLLGFTKLTPRLAILRRIQNREVLDVAKKFRKYPLTLLPGNFINKYTSDLPVYMLTAYFSPAITGAFVLANQMMNIPLNVIGKSISSVFLQRSNELYHNDRDSLALFTKSVNLKLTILGSLSYGFMFAYADILFAFVFGEKWLVAGEIAQILSIYLIIKLVSVPLGGIFRIVGKEQYSLYFSTVLAICRSVGMYLGVLSNDVMIAVLYFSVANILGYLLIMVLVFLVTNLPVVKVTLQTLVIVLLIFTFFYFSRILLDYMIDTHLFF